MTPEGAPQSEDTSAKSLESENNPENRKQEVKSHEGVSAEQEKERQRKAVMERSRGERAEILDSFIDSPLVDQAIGYTHGKVKDLLAKHVGERVAPGEESPAGQKSVVQKGLSLIVRLSTASGIGKKLESPILTGKGVSILESGAKVAALKSPQIANILNITAKFLNDHPKITAKAEEMANRALNDSWSALKTAA